ncbi:hypothetical protein SLE2022_015170 [Rubroshorea leprosula]
MNHKILDFEMARLFPRDETHVDAHNIVRTLGYMAPKYVMNGKFSIKSNVYSFGKLVLEIISCQKIYLSNGEELRRISSHLYSILRDGPKSEMMRCIQLGLLCVQENVARGPTMAHVVLMLSSNSVSLKVPSKQAYVSLFVMEPEASARAPTQFTVNEASISDLEPR